MVRVIEYKALVAMVRVVDYGEGCWHGRVVGTGGLLVMVRVRSVFERAKDPV